MTHADRQDRERWIASGLPDAVVTIMFRDGTLPPPHAARWYDSSLTTDEITEFRRSGRPAPDAAFAASLEASGLPTDTAFIETWEGFDAATILRIVTSLIAGGAGIPSSALAEGGRATVIRVVRRPHPAATDRRFAVALCAQHARLEGARLKPSAHKKTHSTAQEQQ